MNFLERALDGQNQWWKYPVMFLLTFIAMQAVGMIPLAAVIVAKIVQMQGHIPKPAHMMDLSVFGIGPNLLLVLLLFSFVVALVQLAVMLKPMHKRTVSETINGTHTIRWKKYFVAFALWFAILAAVMVISYINDPGNFAYNTTPIDFIVLVAISLSLLPFQTAFEELLFRGYLAQGIGAWTRQRWLAILIPSVLFALMHILNPEVKAYGFWLAMPQYLMFGLLFGIVSVLDDGIETAMGAHAANNIFLAIFITNKDSALQTPALLNQLKVDPAGDMLTFAIGSVLFIAALAFVYKWDFGTLIRKIERTQIETTES